MAVSIKSSLFVLLALAIQVSAQVNCDDWSSWPEEYYKRLAQERLAQKDELERLKKEVRTNSKSAEAHFKLAEAYLDDPSSVGNNFEIIAEEYKRAIRINPRYAEAYNGLALVYGLMNEFKKQFDTFDKAIKIKPDYSEAYYNLGSAHMWNNITKGSIFPDYTKELTLAVEAFRKAIQIKPSYQEAYRGLGEAYYYLERYKEAVEAYKQAIRLRSDDGLAHYDLGQTYLELGDAEAALTEWKTLSRLEDYAEDVGRKCLYRQHAKMLLEAIEKHAKNK